MTAITEEDDKVTRIHAGRMVIKRPRARPLWGVQAVTPYEDGAVTLVRVTSRSLGGERVWHKLFEIGTNAAPPRAT